MKRNYRAGDSDTLAREMDYYNRVEGEYESLADDDYVAILADLASISPPSATLELGCGSGAFGLRLQSRLPSRVNVGLDVSYNLLRHYPFVPVLADGKTIPFDAQAFDLIAACAALHHIHDLPSTLADIFRCLKPNGHVIFVEPNADHPYRRLIVDGGFLHKYFLETSDESIYPDDLVKMMQGVGFSRTRFRYLTFHNHRPSLLGRIQSVFSQLPHPNSVERYIHPWFVMLAAK